MSFLTTVCNQMFWEAFIGLLGITIFIGPLGCLMMWNRVACLGDTLSHGAVLGLSLGILMGINPLFSLFVMTFLWAYLIGKNTRHYAPDTIMAFLAQASLAISILLFSFLPNENMNLMEAFVGNILLITRTDLYLILGMDIGIALCLFFFWKKWILICVNPELAQAKHIPIQSLQILFFLIMGVYISLSIQLMGSLLIPAFLIIPAAAVRPFVKTPEQMAVGASLVALFSAFFGFEAAVFFDVPTGPMLVCVALIAWFLIFLLKRLLFFVKKGI